MSIRALFAPLMAGPPWRETLGFAALTLVASNLFSNVPFVMLARTWVPTLQNPELGWHVLALCSTLAGNLTLIGSVANLIVFEAARDKVRMSLPGLPARGCAGDALELHRGAGGAPGRARAVLKKNSRGPTVQARLRT